MCALLGEEKITTTPTLCFRELRTEHGCTYVCSRLQGHRRKHRAIVLTGISENFLPCLFTVEWTSIIEGDFELPKDYI